MIRLEIITPEQSVFEGDVDSVTLPTADGEITVLPHHIPLVTTIVPGPVIVHMGKEEKIFAVSRGVIEIDQSSVRVLSDIADRADGLEEAAVEKAEQAAQKLMTEKREDVEGFAEATAILERELARLRTVRRHRSRRGLPSIGGSSDS
jgi:F-type H+-transporting ATPase subunit epsilon